MNSLWQREKKIVLTWLQQWKRQRKPKKKLSLNNDDQWNFVRKLRILLNKKCTQMIKTGQKPESISYALYILHGQFYFRFGTFWTSLVICRFCMCHFSIHFDLPFLQFFFSLLTIFFFLLIFLCCNNLRFPFWGDRIHKFRLSWLSILDATNARIEHTVWAHKIHDNNYIHS